MLSIIIPIRDNWHTLPICLNSIDRAQCPIDLEVIVVDDGSRMEAPSEIFELINKYHKKYVRQIPLGRSAARNRGLSESKGDLILFIDSDCTIYPNCLVDLDKAASLRPEEVAFQFRITGDTRSHAGKLEDLRLRSTQDCLLTDNRHIRYVDTAGFAIRRSSLFDQEPFELGLVRGEDSMILQNLISQGFLPFYLSDAIIVHVPRHTLTQHIFRHFRVGYESGSARVLLRHKSKILMSSTSKIDVLRNISRMAKENNYPSLYMLVVVWCYCLESLGRVAYKFWGMRPWRMRLLSLFVNPITDQELMAHLVSAAHCQKGIIVSYLTAWTLVQAEQNTEFRQIINKVDLSYADGFGVVLVAALTRLRLIKKVTANDFFLTLFEELSRRKLRIALIGGADGVATKTFGKIKKLIPSADICMCHSGYFLLEQEKEIIDELIKIDPHIVILSMGQPRQEECAQRWHKQFPNTVFFCVGGLFDVITGRSKSPWRWIRVCGFEWLWRLVYSHRELWRRYLVGIPLLGYFMIRDILRHLRIFGLSGT